MKSMSSILFLIVLAVIITIHQPPQPVPCPQPEPKVALNSDGTYYRPQMNTITLQACYGESKTWKEEWTDYPENGGVFIRRVE